MVYVLFPVAEPKTSAGERGELEQAGGGGRCQCFAETPPQGGVPAPGPRQR